MQCPVCNSVIEDSSAFCKHCGSNIQEALTAANAQNKGAKTEYGASRKAAGKSAAPKVIAGLLGALLLIAAGGCATWYFMTLDQRNSGAKTEVADEAEKVLSRFVGTWTGKLVETTTNYACYGAQENPIEVTVKSIDSLGKMKLDVKVLFHGHKHSDLTSDVDSHNNDVVQEWNDLTATLQNNSFSLNIPEKGIPDARDLVIEGTFLEERSTGAQLEIEVDSGLGYTSFTDKYSLTKAE